MDPRRSIPSVERLLASAAFKPLLERAPRALVADALRAFHDDLRETIAAEAASADAQRLGSAEWHAEHVANRIAELERTTLRHVINATGVVLHTNLGRAPLARSASDAVTRVAATYTNLEYDIAEGARGSRYVHCAALLRELTGADDALVVNNNAAAVVLALNTFARDREVIVSRGELVEIGGGFRVPEILERSGARLREVGATNRVRVQDYEDAVVANTGALLKVHPSNFRITGFTSAVSIAELDAVAHAQALPLIVDLGSGLIVEPATLGLPYEPTAQEALQHGATIVTMSGDKLLGGPQAGIALGSARAIAAMRTNPLCRALRVDKLTLAALEATLQLYRDPARARAEIPVLAMLTLPHELLRSRAEHLRTQLEQRGVVASVQDGTSAVGGGAYPELELPTSLVCIAGDAAAHEQRLRYADAPVIARIVNGVVAIDLRTVAVEEEATLLQCVVQAVRA